MRFKTLLVVLALSITQISHAQIVINEFHPEMDQVEIKNLGAVTMDISSYFLCSFPIYTELSSMVLVSGSFDLGPGELVVLSGHSMGDADDELALYIMPQYTNSDAIIDYVEWGSTGHQRSTVAQAAGIWSNGDFVPSIPTGQSCQWDGGGNASSNWFIAADTFGAENVNDCLAEGGQIITQSVTDVCVGDGIDDLVDVQVSGNNSSFGAWVITDENGEILDLPTEPPFNFEGADGGICLIWWLSYEEGLAGAEVGLNANNLSGCFDLSNSISVNRMAIAGGTVETTGGATTVDVTVGDGIADVIEFESIDNAGENYSFIVTEENGDILAVLEGNSSDFEGAEPGICLVYGVAWYNELNAEAGMNIDDVTADGCYMVSSNSVMIDRQPVGVYELASGALELYPNPTEGQVQLVLPQGVTSAIAEVYSIGGRLVSTSIINNDGRTQIELNTLPSGTYMVVLKADQGSVFRSTLLKQ